MSPIPAHLTSAAPRAAPPRREIRTHILDCAYDLLADHGVGHLTQPRIARAAGVRQSHLTYYFPRRGDLLAALARHSMELLTGSMITKARKGSIGPADMAGVITQALSDRRRVRTLLGLITAADEDPAVRDSLRGLVRLVRARLAQMLEAMGLPHDPRTIALLHTFIVGAGVLHHARFDAEARREAIAVISAVSVLLSGGNSSAAGRPPAARKTGGARS